MLRQSLLGAAAALVATSAAAAGFHPPAKLPQGITFFKGANGVPMIIDTRAKPNAAEVLPDHRKRQLDTISDEPKARLWSFSGYGLCGENNCGTKTLEAIPFIATEDKVKGIDVAIAPVFGGTVDVAVFSDNADLPGERIDGQSVDFGSGGCCATTHIDLKAHVTPGQKYWVVLTPDPDALGIWDTQTSDMANPQETAFDLGFGDGWQTHLATDAPAVRVK